MTNPIDLAELFFKGEYICDLGGEIWQAAFEYIDQHAASITFDKSVTHTMWTVNGGHLRNKIRDDALILRVLKKTMPGYQGKGLTLYRGECKFLYEQQKIGFCWSPNIEVATCFGRVLNALESGGVLLKAYAPAEAILASPNDHSALQMREFEYTCDPTNLQGIEALQWFPKT